MKRGTPTTRENYDGSLPRCITVYLCFEFWRAYNKWTLCTQRALEMKSFFVSPHFISLAVSWQVKCFLFMKEFTKLYCSIFRKWFSANIFSFRILMSFPDISYIFTTFQLLVLKLTLKLLVFSHYIFYLNVFQRNT